MSKLSQNSLSALLKSGVNKWRLAFLVFAVVYAFFILLDLSFMAIQWDEITHLNGGLLLLRGHYQEYFAFNAFYPPMFDAVTTGFFGIGGVSAFTGRLVAVTFALLSLWIVFETANKMYGSKIALISSVLFGLMPGFVWLSRVAMIETMLVFFFTVTMFFFFNWIRTHQNKDLILSGLTLGIGFLVKYQMLVAGVIMIASIFILSRDYLKAKLSRMPLLIVAVALVVIPWIFVSYQVYASGMLDQWIYALSIGNPEKSVYSTRFPLPIFYFIEMTWPYSNVHPISLLPYIMGLLGLGLFTWRRRKEDKFLLTWFSVIFVFFTLIANKHWRYVIPLFPILAISSASLIAFAYAKAEKTLRSRQISLNRKRAVKIAAGLFTVFIAVAAFYSVSDAYYWVSKDQIQVPIEAATNYAASRLNENESIMVVCPFNLFSHDMVKFYLYADGTKNNPVWQYPELPVDTYTPNFDINEFVTLCEERNVKYVFTYEFGGDVPYFNTTLSLMDVYEKFYDSGKFAYLSRNASVEVLIKEGLLPAFGANPRRIIILSFLRQS
ncbi:MAG: glycosyltransferase family 39 protein [Candidatus Bathyarchaeota archaeon]|nr:MAG: glycosyltransferase family 39 protein [Candidatus Bathyarchaeota archaeon]